MYEEISKYIEPLKAMELYEDDDDFNPLFGRAYSKEFLDFLFTLNEFMNKHNLNDYEYIQHQQQNPNWNNIVLNREELAKQDAAFCFTVLTDALRGDRFCGGYAANRVSCGAIGNVLKRLADIDKGA